MSVIIALYPSDAMVGGRLIRVSHAVCSMEGRVERRLHVTPRRVPLGQRSAGATCILDAVTPREARLSVQMWAR